jgi:hypothetical protein
MSNPDPREFGGTDMNSCESQPTHTPAATEAGSTTIRILPASVWPVFWFGIEIDRRYHSRFLWSLKPGTHGMHSCDTIELCCMDIDDFFRSLRILLEPLWAKYEQSLPTGADLDAVAAEQDIKERTT